MDKYYTPDISEFFVGFEYERKEESSKLDSNKTNYKLEWVKQIFTIEELLTYSFEPENNYFKIHLEQHQFRIKYLDKEDIESLGFISSNVIDVLKEEVEFVKGFEKDAYILYVQEDKKLIIYNQKEYDISNKITGNWTEEILFKGYIKNKSELIKLLKQLGIG